MASTHQLIKAFIRAVTTGPNGLPLAKLDLAKAQLAQLVVGKFETLAPADGVIQISSTIGDTAFQFQVDRTLDRAGIMAIAEEALERLETCTTVPQARAKYLTRATRSRPDFSRLPT